MNEQEVLKKIERLSNDKAFGILTRNALEEKINTLNYFSCLFIDFCNMSKLNRKLGYTKVNEIIKEMFKTIPYDYKELIIGRWFSGDEILIIVDDPKDFESCFREHVRNFGLKYKYLIIDYVEDINDIEIQININHLKRY